MIGQIEEVTDILDNEIQERLSKLKHNADIIRNRIEKYPEGKLKIKTVKNKQYYCIEDKNVEKLNYVKKEKIYDAQQIAQRDYDISYLKIAEEEIKELDKFLNKNYQLKRQSCYSDIHKGRKNLIKPFEMLDEDYISRWMEIPYKTKGFNDYDKTEYYTDKGERVRSKSEIIIANTLKSLNIPYKYECPLRFDNITIYPDFTILDVKARTEKYLEHFGMMSDMDYVANMMLKISTYEKNHIYIGDRLICTFESLKRPLNINSFKNNIKNNLHLK